MLSIEPTNWTSIRNKTNINKVVCDVIPSNVCSDVVVRNVHAPRLLGSAVAYLFCISCEEFLFPDWTSLRIHTHSHTKHNDGAEIAAPLVHCRAMLTEKHM